MKLPEVRKDIGAEAEARSEYLVISLLIIQLDQSVRVATRSAKGYPVMCVAFSRQNCKALCLR